MFILSDGEGKSATVELMEPVCLFKYFMHITVNPTSCFGLLLTFLISWSGYIKDQLIKLPWL